MLRPGVPGGSPPDIGAVLAEGDDLGDGGMALALHDAGDWVDIYFGVVAHHATNVNHASMPQSANTPADDLVGALAVYRWNGALALQQLIVFDGSSAAGRKAFGICGLKVGDVIPGNGTDELVVTTLDGQMFVYALVAGSGMIASGLPLYQVQLAGSLGMFNSIEIGDFDNDGKVEVYVAGSLALRRFEQP